MTDAVETSASVAEPADIEATTAVVDGATEAAHFTTERDFRDARQVGVFLAETYPRVFGQRRRPLKVGIDLDIRAAHPEIDPGALAACLRWWTSGIAYLRAATAVGMPRIGLDNRRCGVVTEHDAKGASARLERALAVRDGKPLPPSPSARKGVPGRLERVLALPEGTALEGADLELAVRLLAHVPNLENVTEANVERVERDAAPGVLRVVRADGTTASYDAWRALKAMRAARRDSPEAEALRQARAAADSAGAVEVRVASKGLRVTVPLQASAIPADILPPGGSPVPEVRLEVTAGASGTLTATVGGKTYKRAAKAAQELGEAAWASLQGKLGPGGRIIDPALVVQPKTPREDER